MTQPRAPRVLNMSTLSSMPPDAVYVGRPSRWGNPFKIGRDGNRAEVIAKCETWISARPELLLPLKGKDLVCWCDPLPCHGHIYLRRANDIRAAVTGGRYRSLSAASPTNISPRWSSGVESSTRIPNMLSARQRSELLALLDRRGVSHLAHGNALGYDRSIALCVSEHRPEIEVTAYPPDEALDGTYIPAALLRRNRRMLESSQAQILIALPGGGGTANCLSEGMVMGLEIWEWTGERDRGQFVERKRRA